MVLLTTNKPKQLLYMEFIGHVEKAEMQGYVGEVRGLLEELNPGFRLLADFSRLGSMEPDSASEIGTVMELCDAKGVGMVVRVIPDPSKDIGLSILTLFHYKHRPRIVTCETMEQAASALEL